MMSLRAAVLRGVSTLSTSFHDEAPEEIPHSLGSLGMTLTKGYGNPSSCAARGLHGSNAIS